MMTKISSIEMNNSNTFRTNFSSVQSNDSKVWSSVTIKDQLEKIERWSYKLGVNLVLPGNNYKNKPKRLITRLIITLFLYGYAFKALICQIAIKDTSFGLLLFFGELSPFYGRAINRFYFNWFLISWGFHAAFIYSLISRNGHKVRKWVLRFDENWRHTYFRAPNNDKEIVDNLVKTVSISVLVKKYSIVFYVALMVFLNIYGALTNFSTFNISTLIYIIWAVISVLWCLIASIVNLTALFHYFVLTRAIIIRFTEARLDFEFAIRSEPPADYWVLSKLFEKHYIVCDMVIGSNQHFKNYLFFFFSIMVSHECFLFYQMFTVVNTFDVKCVLGLYIIIDTLQLLLVSLSSAKITSAAHKPYHVVHGVGKMTLPEEVQVQAQLFVQRLSGGSVGMTLGSFFVVTGGVLSSILTGIITYFSIIVEMN